MTIRTVVLSAIAACACAGTARAQATEVVPGFLVYATPGGNIAVAIGTDGVFVVGPLTVASTATIQADLARRTQVAQRYALTTQQPLGQGEGDGGWQRLGAYVAGHENTTGRLYDESERLGRLHAEIPRVAFSEVIKFSLGGQEIHAVHQRPGHSDADVLVHFENVGVVYLGEMLPGDGYPVIDSTMGGSIDGLIDVLRPWAGPNGNRFVPARGAVQRNTDVRAFRDMLIAVRDRVRSLAGQGRTLEQIVAAHPAAEFDARYGHGRVTADAFVRSLFRPPPIR